MVAAPQYATFMFISLDGRRSLAIDAYLSDVASGLVRFDEGQGAGSATRTTWIAPFTGYLVDFTILTGMTDTTVIQLTVNGAPTKDWLRYANHLTTAERPALRIPIPAGAEFGAIQHA